MLGLLVPIIALALLICYWMLSDGELRSKLLVTGIYLATWIFIFIDGWLLLGAQLLFALILGAFTFTGRR